MYLNTILSYSLVIFFAFSLFFFIPPFHWISTFSPFLLPVPLLPSFLVLKFLNCTCLSKMMTLTYFILILLTLFLQFYLNIFKV